MRVIDDFKEKVLSGYYNTHENGKQLLDIDMDAILCIQAEQTLQSSDDTTLVSHCAEWSE